MQQLKLPVEQPYRRDCVQYLNLLFAPTEESSKYWGTTLRHSIETKFSFSSLELSEKHQDFKAYVCGKSPSGINGRLQMMKKIQEMTGLRLDQRFMRDLTNDPEYLDSQPTLIEEDHLAEMSERIKSMSIISHAQGYLLVLKGIDSGSVHHFKAALEKFQSGLASNPNNKLLLRNYAECLYKLEIQEAVNKKLEKEGKQRQRDSVRSDLAHSAQLSFYSVNMQKADQYFQRAIQADTTDPISLYKYARFLMRNEQLESSLEYHLQALEENPNYLRCLKSLKGLLTRMGLYNMVEQIKERYAECKETL